jgi:DeoR family transcriptional regulator, copper-sensing transcriptional repressor
MRGIKRRQELLALLQENGGLAINDLAATFKVSKMTVHRDIQHLELRGLVKKIFGGVIQVTDNSKAKIPGTETGPLSAILPEGHSHQMEDCLICHRPASQHLLYIITLSNGEQRFACCAHCGLYAHLMLQDQVQMAITADFLAGKPHPAQNSFFLLNSIISPCCQPSILTFENREMATRFQTGFGGVIGSMREALEFLRLELTLVKTGGLCPHCEAD